MFFTPHQNPDIFKLLLWLIFLPALVTARLPKSENSGKEFPLIDLDWSAKEAILELNRFTFMDKF